MGKADIFWKTGHVKNVMNSHEIHRVHDNRGRREEGQDYVEDEDNFVERKMDTQKYQDYLDEEDDDEFLILNKVMASEEFGETETES